MTHYRVKICKRGTGEQLWINSFDREHLSQATNTALTSVASAAFIRDLRRSELTWTLEQWDPLRRRWDLVTGSVDQVLPAARVKSGRG